MARTLASLGLAATLLTGCAQFQQQQAQQQHDAALKAAVQQRNACNAAIRNKPEYSILLSHYYPSPLSPPVSILTDDTRPTPEEARLYAQRWDEAMATCENTYLTAIGSPPINAGPYVTLVTNTDAQIASLIARFAKSQMTWAEKARETQRIAQENQAEKATIDAKIAEAIMFSLFSSAIMSCCGIGAA